MTTENDKSPFIFTVTSSKGGVGKTTIAANTGALLADLGQRVLLIDADPQPTLSSYFPLETLAAGGITKLVTFEPNDPRIKNNISQFVYEELVSKTAIEGLDIVLSDDPDNRLREWIMHTPDGRVRLKYILKFFVNYDYIVIDTQGAVGPVQDAAILAADMLLSPVVPEMLSAKEFTRGTLNVLQRLEPMGRLGAPVPPLRAIIYRQDRTADAATIAKSLRNESFVASKGSITVTDTIVPATAAYKEAATAQQPAHRWETKPRKDSSLCARDTMLALVRELIPPLQDIPMREYENYGILMQPTRKRAAVGEEL